MLSTTATSRAGVFPPPMKREGNPGRQKGAPSPPTPLRNRGGAVSSSSQRSSRAQAVAGSSPRSAITWSRALAAPLTVPSRAWRTSPRQR